MFINQSYKNYIMPIINGSFHKTKPKTIKIRIVPVFNGHPVHAAILPTPKSRIEGKIVINEYNIPTHYIVDGIIKPI
jgi:hypothetical protein